MPPVQPMLAKTSPTIPEGPEWRYEPKWDGFRTIVFRDGDDVELGSRNTKPLTRYFPEVVEAVKAAFPDKAVVDGELVVMDESGKLEFDLLSQRIHPAASRVGRLSKELPAVFVAFDALAVGNKDLRELPFDDRRAALTKALGHGSRGVYVTPLTRDAAEADEWFRHWEGAGLDGVVAKRSEGTYRPNERVMVKIKHERTMDCVVGGFRWHKSGEGIVGSLLLGLYRGKDLHHVGVCGAFSAVRRREMVAELEPYLLKPGEDHPWKDWADLVASGGTEAKPVGNRWNAGKDMSWIALRPELVVEVAYGHFQGDRVRHATSFRHWRPDRTPESCTYDQIDTPPLVPVAEVLARGLLD
jgi:ATP-dependent DNA ligase